VMRAKGKGAILNIVTGSGQGADTGAYLSSMAGVAELSHQADLELSPYGIRVYAVVNSVDVVKDVMTTLEAK
jgi:NAD(P)-dependent dehydrogenase (short-subunit alcohol dehydrogenase family)